MGVVRKILGYNRQYGLCYTVRKVYRRFGLKYIWGRRKYPYRLPEAERKRQREESFAFPNPPLISIIVPLFHTPENFLREMLDSVLNQTYPYWELCMADASEDDGLQEVVREYGKKAGRQMGLDGCQRENKVKYLRLGRNGGIAENSNAAAKMAMGEYIALLDHDDLLHPAALYEAARVICQKKADFVYTDELSFVKKPSVVQSVHLKSDFRWEHIRSNNYICHLSVFSRELFWKVGGFRGEYDGAQDYDLFLRMAEEGKEICHIPKVLYYWRLHAGSSAAGMAAKPYVAAAGKRALEEHLRRAGVSAAVKETEFGPFYRLSYYVPEGSRVLFLAEDGDTAGWIERDLEGCPYVVDIWCGQMEYAEGGKQCLDASTEGAASGKGLDAGDEAQLYGKAEVNDAYPADVDYVVLVRRGYRPVNRGYAWLTGLLGGLQWWEHSLAGALIYNRKGQVEHAGFYRDAGGNSFAACRGTVLRKPEGAYPRYRGVPKAENGYMNHLCFTRTVDYLYGAVLAMRWETFQQEFQGQRKEGWKGMFGKEAWFFLCSRVGEQGRYSVLTVQEPWLEEG